jgi:hypothetical protein
MSQLIRRRAPALSETEDHAEPAELRLPERKSLVLMLLCNLLLQVRSTLHVQVSAAPDMPS